MFREWFPSEIKMIFDEYGIKIDVKNIYYGFNTPKELSYFYNKIGTMRSARENKITRGGEFHHELFAQYLSTGKITLNRLDKTIQLGYEAFGRKRYYRAKDIDFVNEILQRIEKTFPFYANDVRHLHKKEMSFQYVARFRLQSQYLLHDNIFFFQTLHNQVELSCLIDSM
jgi:hypothetical protein